MSDISDVQHYVSLPAMANCAKTAHIRQYITLERLSAIAISGIAAGGDAKAKSLLKENFFKRGHATAPPVHQPMRYCSALYLPAARI